MILTIENFFYQYTAQYAHDRRTNQREDEGHRKDGREIETLYTLFPSYHKILFFISILRIFTCVLSAKTDRYHLLCFLLIWI